MQVMKIVVWEEDGTWLGYFQDYPDYWTQGETLDDLKEHLKDLYQDLTSVQIPGIRRVEELVVS
jgi:predicted RNase H-like HicB family nuclease